MALNEKQKQKKRQQRAQKRKKATAGHQLSPGGHREKALAQQYSLYPVHEVVYPDFLWSQGIGNLFFSRRRPDGLIGVAVFLVDIFCLGVKDAFFTEVDELEYRKMKQRLFNEADAVTKPIDPPCMRKLVEGAVAYARELGLEPHKDYATASRIFGDVDTQDCPRAFEYGKDDKPLYIAGPNDSPAMIRRLIQQLEHRCGVDGYDYITPFDL